MELRAAPSGVTDAQITAARDRLIATYGEALRQSDGMPAVERLVTRNAVAANSAAAAQRLTARWSTRVAEPMEELADAVRPDDLLSRSMWPGGSILFVHLGVARLVLALLLGLIALLLRTSMLPEAVQLAICILLLAVVVYLLRAPLLLYEDAEGMDHRIGGLLEPAQREFFHLAGGPLPMTDPAKLIKDSVRGSARLLLIGFLGLVLSPLVASVVSIVRSALGGAG